MNRLIVERIVVFALIGAAATIGSAHSSKFGSVQVADAREATTFKFDFGSGQAAPGCIQVLPGAIYTKQLGYGFEEGFCALSGRNLSRTGNGFSSLYPLSPLPLCP